MLLIQLFDESEFHRINQFMSSVIDFQSLSYEQLIYRIGANVDSHLKRILFTNTTHVHTQLQWYVWACLFVKGRCDAVYGLLNLPLKKDEIVSFSDGIKITKMNLFLGFSTYKPSEDFLQLILALQQREIRSLNDKIMNQLTHHNSEQSNVEQNNNSDQLYAKHDNSEQNEKDEERKD